MCNDLCRDCEAAKADELYEWHLGNVLAERDPANDPTHKPATDAEWWAFVLSGGRD